MKKLFVMSLLAIATSVSANNVTVNGTRFIYPSNQKEITVQLSNNDVRPALIQTWLDEGDSTVSPEDISVPFSITPPVAKVDGKQGQTLRVRGVGTNTLAKDRETLWYLNVLEIPPAPSAEESAGRSVLKTAIRSRFKFFYRPVELGVRGNVGSKLILKPNGKNLNIENPTPFYVTVTNVTKGNTALYDDAIMLAPKTNGTIALKSAVSHNEKLNVKDLNDYGAETNNVLITK